MTDPDSYANRLKCALARMPHAHVLCHADHRACGRTFVPISPSSWLQRRTFVFSKFVAQAHFATSATLPPTAESEDDADAAGAQPQVALEGPVATSVQEVSKSTSRSRWRWRWRRRRQPKAPSHASSGDGPAIVASGDR